MFVKFLLNIRVITEWGIAYPKLIFVFVREIGSNILSCVSSKQRSYRYCYMDAQFGR